MALLAGRTAKAQPVDTFALCRPFLPPSGNPKSYSIDSTGHLANYGKDPEDQRNGIIRGPNGEKAAQFYAQNGVVSAVQIFGNPAITYTFLVNAHPCVVQHAFSTADPAGTVIFDLSNCKSLLDTAKDFPIAIACHSGDYVHVVHGSGAPDEWQPKDPRHLESHRRVRKLNEDEQKLCRAHEPTVLQLDAASGSKAAGTGCLLDPSKRDKRFDYVGYTRTYFDDHREINADEVQYPADRADSPTNEE